MGITTELIKRIYHSPLANIFPMRVRQFQKDLKDCVEGGTMGENLLVSIRFRPRLFWFTVSAALQPLIFYAPRTAFSLFSKKILDESF